MAQVVGKEDLQALLESVMDLHRVGQFPHVGAHIDQRRQVLVAHSGQHVVRVTVLTLDVAVEEAVVEDLVSVRSCEAFKFIEIQVKFAALVNLERKFFD